MAGEQIESRVAGRRSGRRILAAGVGVLATGLLAGACSWVEVDEEAEAVGVMRTLDEVANCRKVGEIGSNTMSKVGFVARNDTKVAVELERLARNDAAAMGANTIVPLGPVTAEGSRRYGAFVCPEQ
jgi:hypothetical protein